MDGNDNNRGGFDNLFKVLSNFFQIVGAIVGILALFVAVRALTNGSAPILVSIITGDELPTPEPQFITSEPIVITATLPPTTPTSTDTSLPTETPLPVNTSTHTPTPTTQPTSTSTSPPPPTITSTPTATPILNTEPGSVLAWDEVWYQDGYEMKMLTPDYTEKRCFNADRQYAFWNIEITNTTDQVLIANIQSEEISVVDDRNMPVEVVVNHDSGWCSGRVNIESINPKETMTLNVWLRQNIGDAQWYILSVDKIGRIEGAQWQLVFPR